LTRNGKAERAEAERGKELPHESSYFVSAAASSSNVDVDVVHCERYPGPT